MANEIEQEKDVLKQLAHRGERINLLYIKVISDQTEEFDG